MKYNIRMDTTVTLPPFQTLIKDAIASYRSQFATFTGILAVPALLSLASLFVPESYEMGVTILSVIVGGLGYLALLIFVAREASGPAASYTQALSIVLPFVWMGVLSFMAVIGGAVFLILPGIYLSVLLSFSSYVFIAEKLRGLNALATSWYYVKGMWLAVALRVFCFAILTAFGGIILGAVAAVIPVDSSLMIQQPFSTTLVSPVEAVVNLVWEMLIVLPLSVSYTYALYTSLRTQKPTASSDEMTKITRYLKIALAIGCAATLVLLFVLPSFLGWQP